MPQTEYADSHEGFESEISAWELTQADIAEYIAWADSLDALLGFVDGQ